MRSVIALGALVVSTNGLPVHQDAPDLSSSRQAFWPSWLPPNYNPWLPPWAQTWWPKAWSSIPPWAFPPTPAPFSGAAAVETSVSPVAPGLPAVPTPPIALPLTGILPPGVIPPGILPPTLPSGLGLPPVPAGASGGLSGLPGLPGLLPLPTPAILPLPGIFPPILPSPLLSLPLPTLSPPLPPPAPSPSAVAPSAIAPSPVAARPLAIPTEISTLVTSKVAALIPTEVATLVSTKLPGVLPAVISALGTPIAVGANATPSAVNSASVGAPSASGDSSSGGASGVIVGDVPVFPLPPVVEEPSPVLVSPPELEVPSVEGVKGAVSSAVGSPLLSAVDAVLAVPTGVATQVGVVAGGPVAAVTKVKEPVMMPGALPTFLPFDDDDE